EIEGGPFDVGCMWDTIEHLRHPRRYIEKVSENMVPGALVALTTGDVGSALARLRGPNWRLVHPPTHLHYFTTESMTRMLENNGLEIIDISHCGFYRTVESIGHGLVLRNRRLAWLPSILEKLRLANRMSYLNTYDIMYVIARKI